ncbi:DUF6293 family protein [Halogeometricum sp. CBA1124]|uniref:HFX_2341 family transcriptional regulator domain-containing protein n=1 Tax=Halogeometricum sp. CBA1124 TaxID=2668071 RepID=UPI00142947D8|nr:DUF6293 family protein [Halogeometricum sp. CBA1124]MUV56723.1 MarR family transcriptional regulator [Halogeometricum sp. CBA1124]
MSDRVHFIPVGFDFDRLIRPITKGELEADRVVLFTHKGEPDDDPTDRAAQLAEDMTNKLEKTFDLVDVEVKTEGISVNTLYKYETLYPKAHTYILDEIEKGNEVFINISSMPRTVSFAFATAADSLITEKQGEIENIRDRVHTYYVAPKEYLVLEMIDVLENAADTFKDLKEYEDLRVHQRYEEVTEILDRIDDSGVTEGTRDDLNGKMHVEFPSSPESNVEGFEEKVLRFLDNKGTFSSTSELAEQMAEAIGEENDQSFRSRVQYNVSKLEDKGYVSRTEVGNRLETSLSTMGRMWLETH